MRPHSCSSKETGAFTSLLTSGKERVTRNHLNDFKWSTTPFIDTFINLEGHLTWICKGIEKNRDCPLFCLRLYNDYFVFAEHVKRQNRSILLTHYCEVHDAIMIE
nr:hypothetical transcript [Hymenolepis microstoma]